MSILALSLLWLWQILTICAKIMPSFVPKWRSLTPLNCDEPTGKTTDLYLFWTILGTLDWRTKNTCTRGKANVLPWQTSHYRGSWVRGWRGGVVSAPWGHKQPPRLSHQTLMCPSGDKRPLSWWIDAAVRQIYTQAQNTPHRPPVTPGHRQ